MRFRSLSDSVCAEHANGALLISYHRHLPCLVAFLCVSCALIMLLCSSFHLWGYTVAPQLSFTGFWVFLLEFCQRLCFGFGPVGMRSERLGPSFMFEIGRRPMLRSIFGSIDMALTAAFDFRAAAAPRLPIAL
jgi:hypothetical protein